MGCAPITESMRRLIVALVSLMMLVCVAAPSSASAAGGAPPDVEPPVFHATNGAAIPPGFRIDADQAVAIAKASRELEAIHRTHHPLQILPYVWVRSHYEIYFYYHGKVIADQIVRSDGQLGPTYTGALILGVWARGHYGRIFDSPWVVAPFTAMFLLPLLLLRRRSWLDRFDLGVVLSFWVSYGLLDHGHLESAVWMFYPPLLYLLARMLARGFTTRPRGVRLDCRLPTVVMAAGLVALIAARIYISLRAPGVIDVGVASALGAYKILHGHSIYYFSLGHGDTYGPLNYLAYVPFETLWPGSWGYLPAARAATLAFDVLTIVGLIVLGIRLRPRREGWRLGLLLGWLWAACPFTLLGIEKGSNDGLVALVMVLILLALNSPIRRGVLVGIGAAAKFFPAILLPLVAVGYGDRDGRTVRKVLAAFVIVVGVSIALFLPSGGLTEVWDHTIGYQLTRADISSIWALHPGLAPLKLAVEAFAALLAVVVAFRPRGARTLAQVAALAAAVIIAVQLPALHWFYLYIPWFMPLVLVAVLAPAEAAMEPPILPDQLSEPEPTTPPTVLAGSA
jgi:Glycosyltransferase family 87